MRGSTLRSLDILGFTLTLAWMALLIGVRIPPIGYDVKLSQHQLVLWPHILPAMPR